MIPEGDDEEMGAGAMLPPRHKLKTSHMARHQSLNRGARNQEQKRIMQENDAFLKRL